MTTKETTPSQRALDHALRLAGLGKSVALDGISEFLRASIEHHARTLDQLWERCPDLAPKTKGELFREEMWRRYEKDRKLSFSDIAAQMIDENWEPKP